MTALAAFVRRAFWPLAVAVLVVLLMQPLYFFSLAYLDNIAAPSRITEHLRTAFDQGVLDDDGRPALLVFRGGEQLTECIALSIGLNKAESNWDTAITGSRPDPDGHACLALHKVVTGANVSWQSYSRYWHGYRIILAPLTAALPFWLVKAVNAMLLVGGCILLWLALRDRCGGTVATVFLTTMICLSDMLFVWRTSPHTISLAFIFAGTWLVASFIRRGWGFFALIVLGAALGSVFNFLDFLVNPPMMPMLLAFFALLTERRDAGLLAFAIVAAWFAGYAETWLVRWIIAYLHLPNAGDVSADISSAIAFRLFGSFEGVYLVPLVPTAKAFLRSLSRVGLVVPAAILVAVIHYGVTTSRIGFAKAAWLSAPVIVPVLWFEALSNHTQIHVTPSSRSAAVALSIILSALMLSIPHQPSLMQLHAHLKSALMKLPLVRQVGKRIRQ